MRCLIIFILLICLCFFNQRLDSLSRLEKVADSLVAVESVDDKSNVFAQVNRNVPLSRKKLGSTVDEVCGEDFGDNTASSGVISFCLFILSTGFSKQEYQSGLPFPPPGDDILSELFTVTHLGWPCLSWFIASLSYASPVATTRL